MRSRVLKVAVGVVATLATLGSLAGCGSSTTATTAATPAKKVFINMAANASAAVAENFNPFSPSFLLGENGGIYEPLFYNNDLQTKGLQPQLGQSYKIAADGQSVDIKLRKGVKWQDGKPFTADDVVFTFDYMLSHKAALNPVYDGKATKVGTYELKLTFDQPEFTKIGSYLTGQLIIPQHLWKTVDNPTTYTNTDPVGTGPFEIGSLAKGSKGSSFTPMAYTLVWNNQYYLPNPQHIAGIRYVVYTSAQTRAQDLLDGKLDWDGFQIQSEIASVKANSKIQVIGKASTYSPLTMVTCSSAEAGCTGPQTDPAVRQAIALAINRTEVNHLAFQDLYTPVNLSLYPYGFYGAYQDSSVSKKAAMKPDLAAAKKVLEDAGWTVGKGDGKGNVVTPTTKGSMTLANLPVDWSTQNTGFGAAIPVMSQELSAIGISLVAKAVNTQQWGDDLHKSQFQFAMYNPYIDSSTPGQPYGFFNHWLSGQYAAGLPNTDNGKKNGTVPTRTSSIFNYANYNNSKVNDALTKISTTSPTNTAALKAQYKIIQQQLAKDMPYIPILTMNSPTYVWTDRVSGWPSDTNLYANPNPAIGPDFAVILRSLKVK